ncbi:MAG: hypothetical protein IJ928_12770 [Prevotella sp.]|nr:hypothetical protein [Prevotella sp.]
MSREQQGINNKPGIKSSQQEKTAFFSISIIFFNHAKRKKEKGPQDGHAQA